MSVDYETKKTKLEADLKKLKQDFKDLKESGGEKFVKDAKNLENTALDFYNNFRTKASEGFDEIKKKIPECKEALQDQIYRASDEISTSIRKKPLEALSIAAGVGLLIGLFLSRKN